MGRIKLKNDGLTNFTSVPNLFLDEFMPKASGDYVKVYLFLLRYATELNSDLSVCKIADIFDYTEKDVIRALKYWEQAGLLSLGFSNNKLSSIALNNCIINNTLEENTNKLPDKKSYKQKDLERFLENSEISTLFYIVQKYIGKPLSAAEMNTLLYFYDDLGFSPDLIEYLVEYCVSNNHKNMKYIEKVGLSWADKKIKTVQEAKDNINNSNFSFSKVLSAFGITDRGPANVERNYIIKWTDKYGFDLDIIIEACNRTIEKTHKPSFEYADSILSKWNSTGINSLEEIKLSDEEWNRSKSQKQNKTKKTSPKSNSFTSFSQRNYDYDELEKRLLK